MSSPLFMNGMDVNELELCHWLLVDQTGNCRSVFAPIGEQFENYTRVGAVASSPQFVFPMAYAVIDGPAGDSRRTRVHFRLHRDDQLDQGPAFLRMDDLKTSTLVCELANAIAQWVESVGCQFHAIALQGDAFELEFHMRLDVGLEIHRDLMLTKSGIEMMAYARGLKCEGWQVV